jgi:drug/metabolite transporter (DMT)-like permease
VFRLEILNKTRQVLKTYLVTFNKKVIYLILSIFCSVLIGFIFKMYPNYKVDTFQAIVFNYFVCVACATVHKNEFPIKAASFQEPWMPYALFLGFVFITGFNGAALTVKYFGLTISQIMQKMSILMTVPFAILWYNESTSWVKIVGILLALVAIVLVNLKEKNKESSLETTKKATWIILIPFITWFLAGIIEVVFVRVQNEKMIAFGDVSFISTVFGTAGVLGFLYSIWGWFTGKLTFSWRNVLGGIVLGIPNYGSMLFILLALGSGLEGSFFFPVCNIGIILLTTFGAVLLFKERLSQINWVGIALAVLSIFCLGL